MQAASSETGGHAKGRGGGAVRDDRVLAVTRLISALVVPFVAIAFVVLYILPYPDSVTRYFAWTIKPHMSAMLMGAGYMAGAYFFSRAATEQRWHRVAIGFPGITAFASLVGVATILHWDKFIHGHLPFFIWVALYATTPFIVPGLWILNRRTDPTTLEDKDVVVPQTIRLMAGVIGIVALMGSIAFLLAPNFMISIWPWQLSVPTSRVASAWFSLFAVVAILMPFEVRWSAIRVTLQSLMLALGLFLVASMRAWDDFDKSNPLTWTFVVGLALLLTAAASLYVLMEHSRGRVKEVTASA